MLLGDDLLDPILVDRLGRADESALREIVNICDEAISNVLGHGIDSLLPLKKEFAHLVVPWVWDLARGLYYQSICGPRSPLTAQLVDQLSPVPLPAAYRDLVADKIDWAYILTLDRVAEFVQGQGAIYQNPERREHKFPWYGRLEIGYRIHLTSEALRLMPSS